MITAGIFILISIVYAIVHTAIVRRYKKELEFRDIMIRDLRALCDVRDRNLVNSSDRYKKELKVKDKIIKDLKSYYEAKCKYFTSLNPSREEIILSLKEDIRMLVSTDKKDAAKSKKAYNKWRAEFGMDEKRNKPSVYSQEEN